MRKGNVASNTGGAEPPNQFSIGGRLRMERERLCIELPRAAQLMKVSEKVLIELEATPSEGAWASQLKMLAHVGYDIVFIVTGMRNEIGRAEGRSAGDECRHALMQLPGVERQRLLLHLVTDELKRLVVSTDWSVDPKGRQA